MRPPRRTTTAAGRAVTLPVRVVRASSRTRAAPGRRARVDALLARALPSRASLEVVLRCPPRARRRGRRARSLVRWRGARLGAGAARSRRARLALSALVAVPPFAGAVNDALIAPFVARMFASVLARRDEPAAAPGSRVVVARRGRDACATVAVDPTRRAGDLIWRRLRGRCRADPGRARRPQPRARSTRRCAREAGRLEAERERAAAGRRSTPSATRIAGELHDVVAHALSAMVIQAAGRGALAAREPDRARAPRSPPSSAPGARR